VSNLSPAIPTAIQAICDLYNYYPTGGLAHVVTDDGNIEDSYVDFCLAECAKPQDDPREVALSLAALKALRVLSKDERIIAIDCADAAMTAPDWRPAWETDSLRKFDQPPTTE
jgi:hypothetical protein